MRKLNALELDAYDVLPRALARRVRVLTVPILSPGARGMTIGRFVLLRHDQPRDGTHKLLAHELVHVRQYYELGFFRFLYRYVNEYLRALVKLRAHRKAYYAIPYEWQAYREADEWDLRRERTDTFA